MTTIKTPPPKKIVFVTSLIGAYDTKLPEFEFDKDKYDFICYTNMKHLKSNTWDLICIDELKVPGQNAKSSYYYKWNPHKYLDHNKYDIMVWVDCSFSKIDMSKMESFINKFIDSDKSLYIEKHPSRNTLKAELHTNRVLKKDDDTIMVNQVERYFKEGYTDKLTVMVETGLSFRRYKDEKLIKFSEAIWNELEPEGNTKRDQLVFDYCMWKTDFKDYMLFTFKEKCEAIMFCDHPNRSSHKEKVLLVGPWLGESQYEEAWAEYVSDYLKTHPVDKVIVGCRPDRNYIYNNICPDKFVISDPIGERKKHLLNGRVPRFNISVKSNSDIITLQPSFEDNMILRRKIHILWATIRPEVFNTAYADWINKAKDKKRILPHIVVDHKEDKEKITEVLSNRIKVREPEKHGVTDQCNFLSQRLKGKPEDIVIFASDDFFPMENWDVELDKQFMDHNGVLIFNDRLGEQEKDIVALPIMTYDALLKMNKVIYHPAYNHCWSDNELYDNAKELGLLKDISNTHPELYFRHNHFITGVREKDEFDEYHVTCDKPDKELYEKRKLLPLPERLRVNEKQDIRLSILICSLESRRDSLLKLIRKLNDQYRNNIEILVETDNGEKTIGEKRNILLDRAVGEYVCFIDDDDMVSDNYVSTILRALYKFDPDCCSLNGKLIMGDIIQNFKHSIKYDSWSFNEKDQTYYRTPNHLNPIRRDLVLKVRYKEINKGEDHIFSDAIKPYIKTEEEIDEVLYFYQANIKKEDEVKKDPVDNDIHLDTTNKNKIDVISFSLWGSNKNNTLGAVKNLRLAKELYPGWICRFYVDNTTPRDILQLLYRNGAQIILMPFNDNRSGSLWRFNVMFDNTVDRFMIRDVNSRINLREVHAVQEWLSSNKSFHIMRDNEDHKLAIMPGLFGGRTKNCIKFKSKFIEWTNNNSTKYFDTDQLFLRYCMWESIKNNSIIHDEFNKFTGTEIPFKVKLPNHFYVGQSFGIDDRGQDSPIFNINL